MKTEKELESLIEAEHKTIHYATLRIKDLREQIARMNHGFKEGDTIEWSENGKRLKGKVFDMSEFFPKAYLFKKDGTIGNTWRYVYTSSRYRKDANLVVVERGA